MLSVKCRLLFLSLVLCHSAYAQTTDIDARNLNAGTPPNTNVVVANWPGSSIVSLTNFAGGDDDKYMLKYGDKEIKRKNVPGIMFDLKQLGVVRPGSENDPYNFPVDILKDNVKVGMVTATFPAVAPPPPNPAFHGTSADGTKLGKKFSVTVDGKSDKWPAAATLVFSGISPDLVSEYKLQYDGKTISSKRPDQLVFDVATLGIKKPMKIGDPSKFEVAILRGNEDAGTVIIEFDPVPEPTYESLTAYAKELAQNYKYNRRLNLLLEENTVHIFIDDVGNFLYGGLPTTATQENTYQFHVVTQTKADFRLKVQGTFKPAILSVLETGDAEKTVPNATGEEATSVHHYEFGVEGPFTEEAKVTIKNQSAGLTILDATIKIAKLYHVSIATGFLATSLRNPSGIAKMAVPNGNAGDSTLVADDPTGRGILSIMAVYYPMGRSFLVPPRGTLFSPERLGIVAGAQLDSKLNENFLAGLSFDFARGGSVTFGAHYGRRNYIAGYDKFRFRRDLIVGDLVVKREWELGLFVGIIVDTRIALRLFNIAQPEE